MKDKSIECPGCHATGTHTIPAMVDVAGDPALKARLLDGTFFEWTCPECGRSFFVDEVLLCCNADAGYCVYLVPGYDKESLPVPTIYKSRCKGTLRVAASFVDFAEKLRIFDAGLNDRVIEAMKAVFATVCQQTGQETVYNMIFEEVCPDGKLSFAVLYKEDDVAVEIPAEAYTHAMEDFDELLPKGNDDEFIKVDQQWLAGAIQGDSEE